MAFSTTTASTCVGSSTAFGLRDPLRRGGVTGALEAGELTPTSLLATATGGVFGDFSSVVVRAVNGEAYGASGVPIKRRCPLFWVGVCLGDISDTGDPISIIPTGDTFALGGELHGFEDDFIAASISDSLADPIPFNPFAGILLQQRAAFSSSI